MKKTLSALVGSLIGIGLLLTIAAVYPEIPTTDYTFGFMTNETAASARTYLGLPSGGVLPYTMVGTNLTAGVLPFVGTYKTNLIDGPAITSAGSNFVILANTNAMLAYLGINNIVVTNRGNGVPLLDTNDNSTIWLKSLTNDDTTVTLTDRGTNIGIKVASTFYAGAMHTNGAAFAQYQVPKAADTSGTNYMPSGMIGDSTGTNMNVLGAFHAHTVTGTNGLTPGSFTVATLPASAVTGTMLYCSDTVTVAGTGGIVWFDGSVWRTKRNNIQATADVPTYILRCYGAQVNDWSATSFIQTWNLISVSTAPVIGVVTGGGTGPSFGSWSIDTVYGSYGTFGHGTAVDGYSRRYGLGLRSLAAGDYYSCGGVYDVSALCNNTDKYWALTGLVSTTTTNFPVTGAFFLYDMQTNSHTAIASAGIAYTNNWICVQCQASSYAYADSGLPVSTSVWGRLMLITTTDGTTFYTNGVACATITTAGTIPTTALYANKTEIYKTAGTLERRLNECFPMLHVRRATAITLP